jgi:squalene-hopene/tetraprenyl-beta-curcumene cyclase
MIAKKFSLVILLGLALAGCESKPSEQQENGNGQAGQAAERPLTEQAGELSPPRVVADETALDAGHRRKAQMMINNGLAFLLSQRQPNGGWSLGQGAQEPALTALALRVLLDHPDYDAQSEVVRKGFDVLMSHRREDGGFYDETSGLPNYNTSLAIMAMTAAKDEQFNDEIQAAVAFLKGVQIKPGDTTPAEEEVTDEHPMMGGVSYGRHGRPDLSNMGFWMEAMHEAGVDPDDPAMQRALTFLERTQNRSESNSLHWAQIGPNDGGFIYAPLLPSAEGPLKGESKAGYVESNDPDTGLRSYGSMTYTGFKSMLYAGVERNDPRIQGAYNWIRKYWRLDSNPNMPQATSLQGLYYYYQVFAKALQAWGEPIITDTDGVEHNWRHELIDALAQRVKDDGSWNNEADRWHEGSPTLVTAYAVMALQETLKE